MNDFSINETLLISKKTWLNWSWACLGPTTPRVYFWKSDPQQIPWLWISLFHIRISLTYNNIFTRRKLFGFCRFVNWWNWASFLLLVELLKPMAISSDEIFFVVKLVGRLITLSCLVCILTSYRAALTRILKSFFELQITLEGNRVVLWPHERFQVTQVMELEWTILVRTLFRYRSMTSRSNGSWLVAGTDSYRYFNYRLRLNCSPPRSDHLNSVHYFISAGKFHTAVGKLGRSQVEMWYQEFRPINKARRMSKV